MVVSLGYRKHGFDGVLASAMKKAKAQGGFLADYEKKTQA